MDRLSRNKKPDGYDIVSVRRFMFYYSVISHIQLFIRVFMVARCPNGCYLPVELEACFVLESNTSIHGRIPKIRGLLSLAVCPSIAMALMAVIRSIVSMNVTSIGVVTIASGTRNDRKKMVK
jgi:hypothetical protein